MVIVNFLGIGGAYPNEPGKSEIGYAPPYTPGGMAVGAGTDVSFPNFWDTFKQTFKFTPAGSIISEAGKSKAFGIKADPLDFWTGAWNPFNLPYQPQIPLKIGNDPTDFSWPEFPGWPDFNFDLSGLDDSLTKYGGMALVGLALVAVIMFLK